MSKFKARFFAHSDASVKSKTSDGASLEQLYRDLSHIETNLDKVAKIRSKQAPKQVENQSLFSRATDAIKDCQQVLRRVVNLFPKVHGDVNNRLSKLTSKLEEVNGSPHKPPLSLGSENDTSHHYSAN